MLIWHCTDFVQLLGCNLDDIKTAITGPSSFMCSLFNGKVQAATGTFFFSIFLSFVSSARTFAFAVSK